MKTQIDTQFRLLNRTQFPFSELRRFVIPVQLTGQITFYLIDTHLHGTVSAVYRHRMILSLNRPTE
jgi:hypothetical protein